jgi:DNA invertase Pin-like site-specific DNA recombinase
MRAFKYLRISDDPEGLELGVTRQDEDTDKLAERLGATVVETFMDNDRSASTLSMKPRERYLAMLKAAQAGECDVILAYSNSRLTRRPAEWEDLLNLYSLRKVEIHTVASGSIDLATADGRAIARTVAAWDAAEAERTSERAKRAHQQRAEQGLPHGGSRPYGWKADRLTLDPMEHKVIKELAQRVISGESLHQIARDLDRRSIRTVRGGTWSRVSIRQMLQTPRMVGQREYHGALYDAQWEPALDELTWRHVCAVLKHPTRLGGSNARVSLLAGIALCGECGEKIGMIAGGKGGTAYHCRPCHLTRLREPVDYYVDRVIVHLLEKGFTPVEEIPPDALKKVDALRAKIAATEAAFVDGDSRTPEQYVSTIRKLNQRLADEEKKLFPAQPGRLAAEAMGPDAENIWGELSLDRRRKVLDDLAEVRLHRRPKGFHAFDPDTIEIIPRL